MPQIIDVGMADFAVAKAPYILESKGIGSCVVTCLYDRSQKVGALCHILLPARADRVNLNPRRFADTALPLVLEELTHLGCTPGHLVAHLIGGASMFQNLGTFINNIGEQNTAAVQAILLERGIRIASQNTGGNRGRNVTFFLDSGVVITPSKTY